MARSSHLNPTQIRTTMMQKGLATVHYTSCRTFHCTDAFVVPSRHPVTSTPFVRKIAKGRLTVGQHQVKVQVHDGLAMRNVVIRTSDGLMELLEKIASAMKRPNHLVEMGYEAPWSAKNGTKKILSYVSNNDELDDFWVAFHRFAEGGKKKKSDDEVVGIIFRNTLDGNQVCSIVLICSIYYAFYSRLHRREALAARKCRRQLTALYSTLVAQRRPR